MMKALCFYSFIVLKIGITTEGLGEMMSGPSVIIPKCCSELE